MKRIIQQLSISGAACKRLFSFAAIILFLFSVAPEVVESRRGFGGSRSFSRSFSRSSSRSYSRSSKSYSRPKSSSSSSSRSSSSRSSYTRPRTSTSSRSTSTRSSYSGSRTSRPTTTRPSTTARQKQTATTGAKSTNTTATTRKTSPTTAQKRQTTAQGRKQVRQLKAENRTLKRKVTTANRQTAQARRQTRSTITVANFGGYYPMTGYSLYSMHASMAFNNLLFNIYFHDYYNHRIRHSYLWHYHHRDYDRSHWSKEKQEEYEFYKDYYESQGVEQNPNYVDPGTNPDENYIASYVEENPDKFYGENAEVVTVDELPDEAAIKQELLATNDTPSVTTNTQRAPPETKTVIIEKKTTGATWFVLVFCSLLIVGGIMLILYNKGYF